MARTKQTAQTKLKDKKYKFPIQGLQVIKKTQSWVKNCISKAAMAR